MSDYLSDLAARSLARTEVILPRLASRFEPASGLSALGRERASLLDDSAAGIEGDTEVLASRQEPASSVLAPAAPPVVPSAETGRSRNAAGAEAAGSRRTPVVQDRGLETIAPPIVQVRSRPRDLLEPAERDTKPGHVVGFLPPGSDRLPTLRKDEPTAGFEPKGGESAQPLVRPLLVQDDPGLADRIRSAVGDVLAKQRVKQEADGLAQAGRGAVQAPGPEHRPADDQPKPPAEVSRPEAQPAVRAQVIAQPQVAIAALARPALLDRAAAGRHQATQEPQPAPTIQVTIGRIEVRATPAPATGTASKPRPAPVVSLDDYLRQRNGGGR